MPRYDFQCNACEAIEEHVFSMADKPAELPCPCGGTATSLFNGDVEVFVPGKPIDFTKPTAVPGWERGNTRQAAEREYARQVQEVKKAARAERRSLSRKKSPMRLKAAIPEALVKARMNQFGKSYWVEEGKKALRRDDLLID